MGKHIHKLSNVDYELKIADCSNCGRVKIKQSPAMKSPKCYVAHQLRVGRSKRNDPSIELSDLENPCEVCGSALSVCYDHDHTTGQFRGWLCRKCNLALGLPNDDAELIEKLKNYLALK